MPDVPIAPPMWLLWEATIELWSEEAKMARHWGNDSRLKLAESVLEYARAELEKDDGRSREGVRGRPAGAGVQPEADSP